MAVVCIIVLVTEAISLVPEIIIVVFTIHTPDKIAVGNYIQQSRNVEEPIEILNIFAIFCILANASFSIVPHLMSPKFRNAIKCCRTT